MSVMSWINAHYNGGESKKARQEWESHTNRASNERSKCSFSVCVVSRDNSNLLELKTQKNRKQAAATDKIQEKKSKMYKRNH